VGRGNRDCKELHSAELYNLHISLNIIRVNKSRISMGGACGTYMKEKRCIQDFGGQT
jgi:hypothetical protein